MIFTKGEGYLGVKSTCDIDELDRLSDEEPLYSIMAYPGVHWVTYIGGVDPRLKKDDGCVASFDIYFAEDKDEEKIEEALNKIAPYIVEGEYVELRDEYHNKWRYILRSGTWEKREGETIYAPTDKALSGIWIQRDDVRIDLSKSEMQTIEDRLHRRIWHQSSRTLPKKSGLVLAKMKHMDGLILPLFCEVINGIRTWIDRTEPNSFPVLDSDIAEWAWVSDL